MKLLLPAPDGPLSTTASPGAMVRSRSRSTGRVVPWMCSVKVLLSSRTIRAGGSARSEEHTSELQSLMRNSYAVFCLKKKTQHRSDQNHRIAAHYTSPRQT